MGETDPLVRAVNELAHATLEYRHLAETAVRAEVSYRHAKARRFLTARTEAKTAVEREAIVEADDTIRDLMLTAKLAEAIRDSQAKLLKSITERVGAIRTYEANQRAADTLHPERRP